MSADMVTQEQIQQLLPAFEAAVYDPLVEMMMGTLDAGPELELARTNVARMPMCRETAEAGYGFLVAKIGSTALRYEVHAQPGEYHHFISLGSSTDLSGHDIVIDPTYLQYNKSARKADLAELNKRFNRVFIGTRYAIIRLMHEPEFRNEIVPIYRPETRIYRI